MMERTKKLAAIDIGTNSFHLVVVEVNENGNFSIVDSEKEVIRLSEGSKGDIKYISDDAILRGINAIKKFVGIANSHNAQIKAVATSAVRESSNKNEFLERVLDETGILIEIISGIEEGRLIYLGVLQAVPVFDKKVLCIDIGGGSTEFVIGYQGKILYANSLKLGAVRLSKKFFPDYFLQDDSVISCRNWTEGELIPVKRIIENYKIDIVVGSSGTIMSAGLMIKAMREKKTSAGILNNYKFSKSDLQKITKDILKKTTPEERRKIKGLDDKRADIIPAGIILLQSVFNQLNIKNMLISSYALREGVIFDIIGKETNGTIHNLTQNIRNDSIEKLSKSCEYDYQHCNHVAYLAGFIFDQLIELHRLADEHKEYLIAAAKLHDIGFHIAHSKHHKHSQYIIVNSELMGFNENEIRAIACIARYHRKSHPKNSHDEFMLLPEEWKSIVRKLSAILRIADAFDRKHNSIVKFVKAEINKDEVIFSVENNIKEIEIELWSMNRRKELFEDVFKKSIKIKSFVQDIA
jgi:exopolyphosphatase/guanosine-5'-triphosphate,3'-diphosphate pyrophosphatase